MAFHLLLPIAFSSQIFIKQHLQKQFSRVMMETTLVFRRGVAHHENAACSYPIDLACTGSE
jgi:hypothetical protein